MPARFNPLACETSDDSNSTDWSDGQALCTQVGLPDEWFPEVRPQEAVINTCNRCAVREQCLEIALVNDERFGVWGGLTTAERDRLKGRWTRR